jgi:hypothetical protein
MDKEKIEKLKERRRQLQEEMRLKKLRDRISSQIHHLENLGESYIVYYSFENLNWINSNVQVRKRDGYRGIHGDFQIDVDDSKVLNNFTMREEEINSHKFSELFLSFIPDHITLIVCYDVGDPELEISVNAFLSHPTEFLSHPETWIITFDKSMIIEYIWEQGVIRFIQLQNSIPTLVEKIIIEYE